jgi:hypothetical protein
VSGLQRCGLRFATWLLVLGVAPAAHGQAVGTTTGIIDGVITDASGAVVTGAVVTASSDALMAARSTESDLEGRYRLPNVPPGLYTLTFSAAGMTTIRRESIYVGVSASVSVDVTLHLATVEETVIVERGAPAIDRQSTTIVTTFDATALTSLPGARSMWSILTATPGVFVGRTDVGGNEAATGIPFSAYGLRGATKPMVEGIVVAGISGTGFTLDYGSFEEAAIGTAAHAAEHGVSGLVLQFTTKSGGNRYRGAFYGDYENEAWQSFNVTDDQILRGAPGTGALPARDVNRLASYSDVNTDIGGFIRRNAAWWYSSFRRQEVSAMSVNFPVEPLMTRMTSGTAKVTLQQSVHRFVAFGQIGRNRQPNRLEAFTPAGGGGVNTRLYESAATADQRLLGWIWKGEWNASLRNDLFLEARAGSFAINRSQQPLTRSPRFEDVGNMIVRGGNRTWQERSRNNQAHGSISYFTNDRLGSHQINAGGQVLRRTADETWTEGYPGDVLHVLRNGEPIEVYFFQTPSTAKSGIWLYSTYAADSWRIRNRLTLNLGVRFERLRIFLPEQTHDAGRFNPIAQTFAAVDSVVAWNVVAPRLGASIDLTGDGRTVLKVNYGRYSLSPGLDTGFNASPNTNPWWERHSWTDSNESGVWERLEEGNQLARRGGTTVESLDPNLELPFLRELAVWIERELPAHINLRSGMVWRGERQHYARQNISLPYEAFTAPLTLTDPGMDGVVGTADDGGTIQAYAPGAPYAGLAAVNMVRNVPGSDSRYVTWDLTATRRFNGRWSLTTGFARMWNRDHASAYSGQSIRANTYPVTPNDLINASASGQYRFTMWTAKVHGTYLAPWDTQLTPSLRLQSGQPFGRTFSASIPGLGNTRILAEPIGTRRMDRIVMMDVRIEKGFRVAGRRAAVFVDVFNLFNSNAEQNLSWSSGAFLRPLDIVAPRILRLGARLDW